MNSKNTVEVDVAFIKEAYSVLHRKWQEKIKAKFPDLFMDVDAIDLLIEKHLTNLPNGTTPELLEVHHDKSIKKIFIKLPSASTDWILDAFEFVKRLCSEEREGFSIFPIFRDDIFPPSEVGFYKNRFLVVTYDFYKR